MDKVKAYITRVLHIKGASRLLVAFPILMLIATACSPSQPDVDKVGLYYTTGWIEGKKFNEVVEPSSKVRWPVNDYIRWFPTNQRDYIVSLTAGEGDRKESDHIPATTKDKVEVKWQLTVTFTLNTSTNTVDTIKGTDGKPLKGGVLRDFNERICKKLEPNCTEGDGWDKMLSIYFRKPLENALQSATGQYTVEELYSNQAIREKLQGEIGASLKDRVNDLAKGQYFCGPGFDRHNPSVCPDFVFLLQTPVIPQHIKDQFEAVVASAKAVETKVNETKQAVEQAKAAKELENVNPNYILLEAIRSGKISFMVLPSGTPVAVPAPAQPAPR